MLTQVALRLEYGWSLQELAEYGANPVTSPRGSLERQFVSFVAQLFGDLFV